jgi:hypothetical protein
LELLDSLDGWTELRALIDHRLEGVAGSVVEILACAESGDAEPPPVYQF